MFTVVPNMGFPRIASLSLYRKHASAVFLNLASEVHPIFGNPLSDFRDYAAD